MVQLSSAVNKEHQVGQNQVSPQPGGKYANLKKQHYFAITADIKYRFKI